MYRPIRGIKNDPERRWNQPDRIFFGFGACHILAGVFLAHPPFDGFFGEWIVPDNGFHGHHFYVTNGTVSFDFHGYSLRDRLLAHYRAGHQKRDLEWSARVVKTDFPLLDTTELNARQHRGPDQYFGDPIPRAQDFIAARKCPPHLLEILQTGEPAP